MCLVLIILFDGCVTIALTSLGRTYFHSENLALSSRYQYNSHRNLILIQICELKCLVWYRRAFWTQCYS